MNYLKIKKTVFYLILLIIFNSCAQTTAMLGPALTAGASGGNIYKTGFQFGSNYLIEQETGKSTLKIASDIIEKHKQKNKLEKDFIKLVENKFNITRQKILALRNQID